MYRTGHLGVALLVFAPIGLLLVSRGLPLLAFVTGGVMLWLAMAPDVDHRLPLVAHRGPTHSLSFAAVVGGGFATVAWFLGTQLAGVDRRWLAAVGFGVGALTVLTHLLADALTPAGVPLLWPFSDRTYSLSVARADSTLANYGLFVLGVFATATAIVLAFEG